MANVLTEIDDKLAQWIAQQHVFFVATAPLGADGHINVSPKGMAGTFLVLGPHQVAYLDYYGSGAETIAHLRENGRIVLMFCAFDGPPRIVRLHGRGRAALAGASDSSPDEEFSALRERFSKEREVGQRSIIIVDVERIADSCGYSVPLLDFRSDRDILDRGQQRRDPSYFDSYGETKNATSIDGLPALR